MRYGFAYLLFVLLASFVVSGATADALPPGNPVHLAKAKPPRADSFGDPLPDCVYYRIGTVRLRHHRIQSLIFSADGSTLLSQGWTRDLRVWDVETGRLSGKLAMPEKADFIGNLLIASPDDRNLACMVDSAQGYQVVLLDKATGKELARWGHTQRWQALAFSKDSKELIGLASEKAEHTVVRWNIADCKQVARIPLDMTKVDVKNSFDYWGLSPDGTRAAFMSPNPMMGIRSVPWYFWDTATGKQIRPPLMMAADRSDVCWSHDARMLAVADRDNTLKVWDIVAGTRAVLAPPKSAPKRAVGTDGIMSVAFQPGGKLLAVRRLNRVIVWDVEAEKQVWEQDVSASALAFSPDGKTFAAGGEAITLFESATGERVGFSRRDPGFVSPAQAWGWGSAVFCWDGRSFMIHDKTGLAQIETATGKRLRSFSERKGGFSYGGLCDDGRSFIRVADDNTGKAHIFMIDAATGKELWRRPKQPMGIYAAADCMTLAVLSWDEDEFTLLDARTGRELKKLPVPAYRHDGNTCKTFSGDLRVAASAHNIGGLNLWDVGTGKKIRSMEAPPAAGEGSLTFSAGGKQIIWTVSRPHLKEGQKEFGCAWDVETGRKLRSFDAPVYQVSLDRRWLALESDKGIAIRHLQTGRLVATIAGSFPPAHLHPLTFSPDSSMVAVWNRSQNEVGVWDTFTGQLVRRWVDHLYQFHQSAFTPDGRTLLLSDRGGGSMLVGDVTGRATEPGKLPVHQLTQDEVDRLWQDLTCADGPRSHQARWTLVAGGDTTVKMLERRLRPVDVPDAKKIGALIADLDSSDFKRRQESSQALDRMEAARPALQKALQSAVGLEMKRRIEMILTAQENLPWSAELPRNLRGVLLLEQIDTPPARNLLRTLADGAAGTTLTNEAQAALRRLALSQGMP